MTYLFDQGKAMAVLEDYERQWGGNLQQRMAAKYSAYAAKFGATAPRAPGDDAPGQQDSADARDDEPATPETAAASPAAEPDPGPTPTASTTTSASIPVSPPATPPTGAAGQ
jgi:penicillin-binding protein 2